MGRIFEGYENIPIQNMEPVTEAYIGKTKPLLAAEKELDIIIRERKTNPLTYDMSSDGNPHVKAVGKLLQKQFGFKECVINFVPNMTVNACTVNTSLVSRSIHYKSYRFDKKRGHYDEEHCISSFVTVFEGLLENDNMTGGVLLAIILHEIGHDFDNSPWLVIQDILLFISSPIQMLIGELMKERNIVQRGMTIISNIIYRIPSLETFLKLFTGTTGLINGIKRFLHEMKVVNSLMSGKPIKFIRGYKIEEIIAGNLSKIAGAPGEIHSDELAAVYGYGAELSKGLVILRNSNITFEGIVSKNPATNLLVDVYSQMYKIIIFCSIPEAAIDCHPSAQARVKSVIDKYERDLANSDFPPEMKKELIRELEETKEIYKGYIECTQDGEKGKVFSMGIRMIKDKITGGHDWHNALPTKHL